MFDIIPTIYDEDNIENFSEDSDEEKEFQPSKKKNKLFDEINSNFKFVSSTEEYNKDPWQELSKYVKRKVKHKTDDKIKKILNESLKEESNDQENNVDDDNDLDLSDEDLKKDNIRDKEKKKKKQKTLENENFFEEEINEADTNATFHQMNLSRPLLKAISTLNYSHPTPIQSACIPVALLGKDICACAATGTGKTAAYMLPVLERLLYRPVMQAVTRVLVLVPTRELGVQVYQVTKQLCTHTNIEIGLSVGGLDLKRQEYDLRKNPDIVIATPGRLIDHLRNTPSFSLESIEVLILDEADRMLDEYFAEQMKEIIKQCSRTRQTMLFSATMTDAVEDLAAVSLKKPVKLFVNSNKDVAFTLRQEFIRIRSDKESDREAILAALVCRTFHDNCMVFVQTKKQAHRLHLLLGLLKIKVGELHGNLTQPQRLDSLKRFKENQVDVLIATDVAARGLDISGVKTVINFTMPPTLEHYIHRVGRTARAGRAGVSVSLAGESERKLVRQIVKRATNPVKLRVIPSNIIEKYRQKLASIEDSIKKILDEEYAERILAKAENQANKAEKILGKQPVDKPREWFQSKKQRKEEKDKLSIKLDKKEKGGDKKKKNKTIDDADKRVKDELNRVALVQARLAKKMNKPKRLQKYEETINGSKKLNNKKRGGSTFDVDLFDVSKKGVKKARYEANKKQKENSKFGKGGFKKSFGRQNKDSKSFNRNSKRKNKK